MARLILLAAMAFAASGAVADETCWEYRVTNAPYDMELATAQVEAAMQINPFRSPPGVDVPWVDAGNGVYIHQRRTDFLNSMAADDWELTDISTVSYGTLLYFRRSCR